MYRAEAVEMCQYRKLIGYYALLFLLFDNFTFFYMLSHDSVIAYKKGEVIK